MEISLAIIALISIATYFNKFISTFLIACTCACLIFFINLFIFILFLAVLGLRCCARAFSTCHERGYSSVAVRKLFVAVASLVAEHGL